MKPIILTLALTAPFFGICGAEEIEKDPKPTVLPNPVPVEKPGIVGSSWRVENIGNKGVIDNAHTFVRFDSAEKVSGSGGVNRFSGSCILKGDKLSFGPLASTRMAGPPAVMNQETAFLAALAEVRSFRLDGEKDLLHFLNAEGKEILRMSRESKNP